ncbi:POU domain, class 6, transcription factor 2 [Xenoophorus captivus]|uniref:POU domain, class 6, transcription factor 2 n=1 Tax=Xenoophorus captivus TaxID=1517983 RepID=A0ABV0QNT4_9TELE
MVSVCMSVCLLQSLLVAQQLANAVGGVMSGAAPGLNQPILIPFNAGGHLGGQQGLVLSLPTANIQSLVAAAAAGGIMTLPLQNLQGNAAIMWGNGWADALSEEMWSWKPNGHKHA